MSELPLENKTALVTGASDGIGYATARRLLDDGATVIVHASDQKRGEDAFVRLIEGGAEPLCLQLVIADFTRLSEVANLGDEIARELPELDVLINNAAVAGPERRTYTEDGHEVTFGVNYLAAYVLTTALIGPIAKVHGRVINVSSTVHLGGNVGWNDLDRARHYSPLAVYAQSKLALTMFTRSLAEANSDLTALSVNPGAFDTQLAQASQDVGQSVSNAAAILATLSSPATTIVNGAYYDGRHPARAAALVDNARARTPLTTLSDRLTRSVLTASTN
jgi:NAD(P)-dependent dehydrogenase (short-subunit alcohol dehydrogenase family)